MVDFLPSRQGDEVLAPVKYPEATYAVKRLEGVKKALDEVGATVETVGTGAGFEEALPKMVQYLIGHPDIKAVISLGGTPTALAPQAISEAKLNIPTAVRSQHASDLGIAVGQDPRLPSTSSPIIRAIRR